MATRILVVMTAGMLVAAVLVGAAGAAGADDGLGGCPGMDASGNGVERGAADADAVRRWQAIDVDGHGGLTRDEVSKVLPEIASRFDALDQDHDGRLTLFEIHHPPGTIEPGDAGADPLAPPQVESERTPAGPADDSVRI